MIIDGHTHLCETSNQAPRPVCGSDLVREMDAADVQVSVVLPLPGVASNAYVHAECERHAPRLVGLYTPEFDGPGDTVERAERFCRDHDVRGIKIHPRVQQVTVEDAAVRDVLSWACERRFPVLFDVFPYGPSLDDPRLHPLAYHGIAQRMPELKMILAHAGGYRVLEAFMVAKSNPNVYLDASFTFTYFRGASAAADLGFVCRRLPAGRVVYGSDFPSVALTEYLGAAREAIGSLTDTAETALWGGAAQALFKIP